MTACLLNENHDFLRLAINAIRNDVIGRNETFQCLALTLVWLQITCFTLIFKMAAFFVFSLYYDVCIQLVRRIHASILLN